MMAQLTGSLGALALLLASLGVYGLASYVMSRRRAEMAIRIALGAVPTSVLALVLARVSLLVAVGVVAGGMISLWAAQFVAGLVYGFPPRDAMTLVGAAGLLLASGALAVWIPARRATRLDPLEVLRES